jgi:hypothetical protein
MAYYPDSPQPADPGQQPWASHAPPAQGDSLWPAGALPQNFSGNALPPSMPAGSPFASARSVPAPAIFPPAWQPVQQAVSTARPLMLALLAFPFLSFKMFVWPGPATFAREKDRAGRGAVFYLLLVGAVLVGVLAFLWGRVPRLTPGIENLSAGRVVPHPLSVGACASLAVGIPLLFLLLEGILYWVARKRGGQRSSVRAQLYTGLLIEAPLYALVVAFALLLLYRPDLGSSARLLFAIVAGAFLLYSLLLHIFAVMAVHRIGAGKAVLCVALIVVLLAAVVVVVVVALLALGEDGGNRSGSSSHASGGDHKKESNQVRSSGDHTFEWHEINTQGYRGHRAGVTLLFCTNCGLQLPVALGQLGSTCPRCGAPMMHR